MCAKIKLTNGSKFIFARVFDFFKSLFFKSMSLAFGHKAMCVAKFDERGKVARFYEKSQQEGVSC